MEAKACTQSGAGCRTCARCLFCARRVCSCAAAAARTRTSLPHTFRTPLNFPAALAVSFLIELSQLWHPPFLEALRATTIGGLVLGYGFLRSDLVCYTVGACICLVAETAIRQKYTEKQRKVLAFYTTTQYNEMG